VCSHARAAAAVVLAAWRASNAEVPVAVEVADVWREAGGGRGPPVEAVAAVLAVGAPPGPAPALAGVEKLAGVEPSAAAAAGAIWAAAKARAGRPKVEKGPAAAAGQAAAGADPLAATTAGAAAAI
jgi:hypothetical protein